MSGNKDVFNPTDLGSSFHRRKGHEGITTIEVIAPENIEGRNSTDIASLTTLILNTYYGSDTRPGKTEDFDISLNLKLSPEAIRVLFESHAGLGQALEDNRGLRSEIRGLRSENELLQQEIKALELKVRLIEEGKGELLQEFETKIRARYDITTLHDFLNLLEHDGVGKFADYLFNTHYNSKEKSLSFLAELFNKLSVPDSLKVNPNSTFIWKGTKLPKEGSNNDKLKDRISSKTLAEYEGESMKDLLGNGKSKQFYKFVLECWLAGVKLAP